MTQPNDNEVASGLFRQPQHNASNPIVVTGSAQPSPQQAECMQSISEELYDRLDRICAERDTLQARVSGLEQDKAELLARAKQASKLLEALACNQRIPFALCPVINTTREELDAAIARAEKGQN